MRLGPLLRIAGALLLLASLMPFASSASLAVSPTPTKSARKPAAPRAPGSFQLFIPYVLNTNPPAAAPKKGAGLTYLDCASAAAVQAVWQYGWSATPANCSGIENVPMIYGSGDVNATLGGNSEWLMGFNEPDSASQADISASQAATLWRQIEQKYPSRKLVAPAPSGSDPNWLVDFRNAYIADYGAPPRLDALAVHCYAWQASACIQFTQNYYEAWAKAWGVPEVWVTEFSFATTSPNTPSQSLQEGQTYISWIESDSLVTRFAWFASKIQGTEAWLPPSFDTPLIDWTSGNPTAYGSMYLPYR